MSDGNNALIPRTGPAPRLSEGPRAGQRSLYHQQVLDEDTYTEALSNIITRDFFPNLPHIHATNSYLTALTNNDPELLSSSIRRLTAIAQEKENRARGNGTTGEEARQRELDNVGTPYMSLPGGGGRARPLRTPVGARGWDTPIMRAGEGSTRRRPNPTDQDDYDELEGDVDINAAGGSSHARGAKRRKAHKQRSRLRDDLPLDAFQANYTSEDNASFVQIVDEENRRRQEERWSWAWEAEARAENRRLEGEEKRKMILDAATSGQWKVNAEGRRLVGALAEGGTRDQDEGEAWKDRKLITALGESSASTTKTKDKDVPRQIEAGKQGNPGDGDTSKALVTRQDAEASRPSGSGALTEHIVPEDHPLRRALEEAGLPSTALVSTEDGAIVPHHEVASGADNGRGRGQEDRERQGQAESFAMGDGESNSISLGGSGADMWQYKTMNNLMFPADANTKPYPKKVTKSTVKETRQPPKAIQHANTRLPEEEEGRHDGRAGSSTRRGSSPARSWVDAAVKGTPYRPGNAESGPSVNSYPLLPHDASPSPTDLPSLLTWGTLLATPRALDGTDDPLDLSTPSFRMPDSKRRDEIGRKLGDKASRSMNERAKGYTPKPSALRALADKTRRSGAGGGLGDSRTPGSGSMMPPSATPKRDGLTPAGKRLLERSMGFGGGGLGGLGTSSRNRGAAMEKGSGWGGSGGGKAGLSNMSWTPSPARRK